MTLNEFREDHSGAPYCLEGFVDLATGITDCDELMNAAVAFQNAQATFLHLLEVHDIEVG